MTDSDAPRAGDLTRGRLRPMLYWGLPVVAMIVGGILDLEFALWPPALMVMGAACVVNAARCRRLHCFFTGPWFLALAALSVLHGTDTVVLGAEGWRWLGIATLVGGVGLMYVPERLWGRYARRA